MDDKDKPSQLAPQKIQSVITLHDLQNTWIGIGAAIDWIAMRGQEMEEKTYRLREDAAAEALVAVLADMPPATAEALVRGAMEGEAGPLVPIPSGTWRQTATSDANDEGQLYRLIGTDDQDELDGAILSVHVSGYRRIQIRANFIRDCWPDPSKDQDPSPIRRAVAQAELRHFIEKAHGMAADLSPLTQREIIELVKSCMPTATRDLIRQFHLEFRPNSKPGPRGPRDPDRKARIRELGGKLSSAQLHN